MKQQTVEQIKRMINEIETLSSSEKKELLESLEVVAKYNTDLNKNVEIQKVLKDAFAFLKEKDGMNREDKLLEQYGLSRDSSKEKIINKRDEILDELYRKQKRTRYIDKAKRLKVKFNVVKEHFDLILDRYDNRTLAGDLSKKEVRQSKYDALIRYAKLVDNLSEFAVETDKKDELEDSRNDAFNYAYEGMSDKEIGEFQKDLNTHPIRYASYGNNTKEYLEPIEYFPNTNIRKPRVRGPFETEEHYEAFLTEYYSRYDFSNPHKTTQVETEKFYSDKVSYAESTVQSYFGKVRDSLANLRWFYNYSLNESTAIDNDVEFYSDKIKKNPNRKAEYEKYIDEGKENREVFQEFIQDYDQKLESVNTIMGKVFNEPALVGDTSLTIELSKDGDKLTALVSPLVTLVDDENRKKYANYEVDENGEPVPFDQYEFDINTLTNQDIDSMLTDFVQEIVDQDLVDIDVETVKKANVEVYFDDKTFVMPYEDLGVNLIKVLKLGKDAYVPKETYKEDAQVNNYVNNVGVEQAHTEVPVENPEDVTGTVTPVVEEIETPVLGEDTEEPTETLTKESVDEIVETPAEETAKTPAEETVEENVTEEENTNKAEDFSEMVEPTEDNNTNNNSEETVTSDENIIIPTPLPIGIEDKGGQPTTEEEYLDDTVDEAQVDESLLEEDTQEEIDTEEQDNRFHPGDAYYSEDEYGDEDLEEDYYDVKTPHIDVGDILDTTPLTQEELRDCYTVKSSRKPRHFKKTVAAGLIGGALTAFGLATVNGPAVLGGSALLTGTVGFNWKNLKRAVQKFKLKAIARRNGAKAYFGKNGNIEIKNDGGSDLTEEQIKWIQHDLDKLINSWNDPLDVPRVTLDNLGHAFVFPNDDVAYYTTSKKDLSEYKEMRREELDKDAEEDMTFSSVESDLDLYGDEEDQQDAYYDDEEQSTEDDHEDTSEDDFDHKISPDEEEKPVLYGNVDDNNDIFDETDLYHELVRLNPELASLFKQDSTGYWLEIPNPESVRLPQGFEYIDGVGFTNINTDPEQPIQIDVIKTLDFSSIPVDTEEPSEDKSEDNVNYLIGKYGFTLKDLTDDELQRIINVETSCSAEDIEAAINKMNSRKSL